MSTNPYSLFNDAEDPEDNPYSIIPKNVEAQEAVAPVAPPVEVAPPVASTPMEPQVAPMVVDSPEAERSFFNQSQFMDPEMQAENAEVQAAYETMLKKEEGLPPEEQSQVVDRPTPLLPEAEAPALTPLTTFPAPPEVTVGGVVQAPNPYSLAGETGDTDADEASAGIMDNLLAIPRSSYAGFKSLVGGTISKFGRDMNLAGKPSGAIIKNNAGQPVMTLRAPGGVAEYDQWLVNTKIEYGDLVSFVDEGTVLAFEPTINDPDSSAEQISMMADMHYENQGYDAIAGELALAAEANGGKAPARGGEDNPYSLFDQFAGDVQEYGEGVSAAADLRQAVISKPLGFGGQLLAEAGHSLGVVGPGLMTRNPAIALSMMGFGTRNITEDRDVRLGKDIITARIHGNIAGLSESLTETMPVVKMFADVNFGKKLIQVMIADLPGEEVNAIVENMTQALLVQPDMTYAEFKKNLSADMIHTLLAAPLGAAVQTGARQGFQKAVEKASPILQKFGNKIIAETPEQAEFREAKDDLRALGIDEQIITETMNALKQELQLANDEEGLYNFKEELQDTDGPIAGFLTQNSKKFGREQDPLTPVHTEAGKMVLEQLQMKLLNGAEGTGVEVNLQPGEVGLAFHNSARVTQRTMENATEGVKPEMIAEQKKLADEADEMVKRAHELLQKLVTRFLPNHKILLNVGDRSTAITNKVTNGATGSTNASMLGLDGVSIITINPKAFAGPKARSDFRATNKLPQTLAHELGHALVGNYLSEKQKEFPNLPNLLKRAYVRAVQTGAANMQTFGESIFSPGRYQEHVLGIPAIDTKGASSEIEKNPNYQYLLSLEEFIAEQMIKYALGQETVQDETSAIFHEAGGELKRLYDQVSEEYAVDESFEEFVEHSLKIDQLNDLRQEREKIRQRQAVAIAEIASKAPQELSAENLESLVESLLNPVISGAAPTSEERARQIDSLVADDSGGGFSGWPKVKLRDFSKKVNDDVTRMNWFISQAASLLEIVKMNKHIPGVVMYGQASENFWNTKMGWTSRASDLVTDWRRHVGGLRNNGKHSEAFDNMMVEADEMSNDLGRKLRRPELLEMALKHGLKREDIAMMDRIWNLYGEALTEMEEVLINRIMQVDRNADPATRDAVELGKQIAKIRADFRVMRDRNYIPHSRFGKFTMQVIAAKDVLHNGRLWKKGAQVVYTSAETHRQRAQMVKQLQKEFGGSSFEISGKTQLNDTTMMMQGLPPELIHHLRQSLKLTEEQAKELDEVLKKMQPGQGIRKHFLKRKNVAGYNHDMQRVFADYFSRFANHIARTKHEFEFDDALAAVSDSADSLKYSMAPTGISQKTAEEKRRELLQSLTDHREYLMNPGEEYSGVRAIGFLWYLGMVPKSAIINLTQVPMVVYPYLGARFGDVATAAEMTKSMALALAHFSGTRAGAASPLSAGQLEMWQALKERGLLEESMVTELAATAQDQTLLNIKNDGTLMSGVRASARWAGYMFQTAEKMNRYYTSLAAYNLGVASGMGHQEATQFAWQSVVDTQFEYARFNRAKMMRGWKSVPFLFMQYLTNMMFFVGNDPGRWRYLMMTLMIGGYTALPGMEDFLNMLNTILPSLKSRMGVADPKKTIQQMIAEMVNTLEERVDFLPDNLNQRVERGLGGDLWGYDIQGSMSLGKILPLDTGILPREMPPGDKLMALMLSGTGAPGEALFNMMVAAGTEEPWSWRSFEKGGPTAVKNMMKAQRRFSSQHETDKTGQHIMTFDQDNPYEWMDLLMEGSGFPRSDIKLKNQENFEIRDAAQYYSLQSGYLRTAFFKLQQKTEEGYDVDKEDWQGLWDKLERYNKGVRNLDPRLILTPGDLVDSWVVRKDSELTQEIFGHKQVKFQSLAEEIRASKQ